MNEQAALPGPPARLDVSDRARARVLSFTGVLDTAPTVMTTIAAYGFLILVGAGVGVSAIFFLVGFVLGKAATR